MAAAAERPAPRRAIRRRCCCRKPKSEAGSRKSEVPDFPPSAFPLPAFPCNSPISAAATSACRPCARCWRRARQAASRTGSPSSRSRTAPSGVTRRSHRGPDQGAGVGRRGSPCSSPSASGGRKQVAGAARAGGGCVRGLRLRADPAARLCSPRPASTCLNLHASLLPRLPGGGADPGGDPRGGRGERADGHAHGLRAWIPATSCSNGALQTCRADETGGSLHDRLADIRAGRVVRGAGRASAPDTGLAAAAGRTRSATHAPKLDRQSGRIDWHRVTLRFARPARPRDEPVAGRVHDAAGGRRPVAGA